MGRSLGEGLVLGKPCPRCGVSTRTFRAFACLLHELFTEAASPSRKKHLGMLE
jgi:hypothetical protein